MKKKGLFSSLLLSVIILAACNNSSEEILAPAASPELTELPESPESPAAEQSEAVEQPPLEDPKQPVDTPSEELEVTKQPSAATTTPTTPFISAVSAALNYTILHPEGYTLSEEEPGKDMLFYNENDALSMRIEVTTEASFDSLNELTQQSLANIAPNNTYKTFDLTSYLAVAQRTDITAYAAYIVEYESDKVISIVYEIKDKMIVLTIFDDYITGITDTFIQAGLTIH